MLERKLLAQQISLGRKHRAGSWNNLGIDKQVAKEKELSTGARVGALLHQRALLEQPSSAVAPNSRIGHKQSRNLSLLLLVGSFLHCLVDCLTPRENKINNKERKKQKQKSSPG